MHPKWLGVFSVGTKISHQHINQKGGNDQKYRKSSSVFPSRHFHHMQIFDFESFFFGNKMRDNQHHRHIEEEFDSPYMDKMEIYLKNKSTAYIKGEANK
jgi:hypothetical protein